MDTIDDDESRDRLKDRTMDQASSAWYTYNQHYKAANFYKFLSIGLSSVIAIIGGVLSYGLIWDELPNWFMISMAVAVSVISGIQLVVEPGEKRDRLHHSAQQYHALFDDLVDFLSLDLPSESKDIDELQRTYEGFREQRESLNQEMPDVSSLWYRYIKFTKGSGGMREAFAGDVEQELFDN
jgi:hypothetical protein